MKRVFAMVAAAGFVGCPTPSPSSKTALITLSPADGSDRSGAVIDVDDLRRALARRRLEREGSIDAAPFTPALRESVLDELLESRMLALEAKRRGLTVTASVVAAEISGMKTGIPEDVFRTLLNDTYQTEQNLEEAVRQRLLVEALVAEETPEVGRAEFEGAWDAMPPNEKLKPARVRAAQIVVSTEAAGEEVLRRLRRGEAFEALARSHSIAPNAPAGGYLGWFARGEMPEFLEQACFALGPEQVSALTASEYGFHLFKVYEKEEARPMTLEEARPALVQQLRDRHARRSQQALLDRIRRQYDVTRNQDLLQKTMREGL